MADQPDNLKDAIKSAVASGYQGYKARLGDDVRNPDDLIKCIAGSVMALLDQSGQDLADAGTRLKIEQLQRDLAAAQQGKNRLAKAHELLAVRLGIWGKPDSSLGDDAWYIWVDRQPAWNGYLPQAEFQEYPIEDKDYQGFVYSTKDEIKALSFVSEDAARSCIGLFVHPHLRPYCTPTQRRE